MTWWTSYSDEDVGRKAESSAVPAYVRFVSVGHTIYTIEKHAGIACNARDNFSVKMGESLAVRLLHTPRGRGRLQAT